MGVDNYIAIFFHSKQHQKGEHYGQIQCPFLLKALSLYLFFFLNLEHSY